MKKVVILMCALFCSLASFSQPKFENWPEMRTFRNILSETFHPAEEGDMTPIKTRSHELFANAKLVNVSPIPEANDNEEMRTYLKRLQKETDKLNAIIVRQEQSSTIMKQFAQVHDTFHEIAGMYKETGKKHTRRGE